MKFKYLLVFSALFLTGFTFLANLGSVQSQDNVTKNNMQIGANLSSRNTTAEFSSITNFSQIAKDYETSKRLESAPSSNIIDKEAALEEFEVETEELKENLDRFETSVPSAERLAFNAQEVLSSNSTTSNSSVHSPESNLIQQGVVNSTQSTLLQGNETGTIGKPSISRSWRGLDIVEAGERSGMSVPPDVTLAVGPDHIVQMVHSAARIWDKNGQEVQTAYLADFFRQDQFHTLSDPIVLFDPSTDRWFSVIMEISPNREGTDNCVFDCFIDVATSLSNNPTGLWKTIRVPFGKVLADYPMVGISDDKFVFGVNNFGPVGEQKRIRFLGTQAVIMDKNSMIQNDTNVPYSYSPVYNDYGTIYPVSSPSRECMYMEANDYSDVPDISRTNGIILFDVCGNPATNDLKISINNISILTSYLPPEADQPSNISGERILGDTDHNKIRGPVYFNNTFISAFTTRCINENNEPQSCIRILKMVYDGTDYISSAKDLFANDAHLFFPSLMIDKSGNMVMVMGTSSRQIYPTGLVAILDQNLNVSKILPVIEGTANTNPIKSPDSRPRSGDYFAAARDPVDGSVWVSGEYGDSSIQDTHLKWSTFVANIS